jgi:hypothetical protein
MIKWIKQFFKKKQVCDICKKIYINGRNSICRDCMGIYGGEGHVMRFE